MRLKFGKMKRKLLNKRLFSAFLGFAFASASVPYVLSFSSIPVSADAGEFSGISDYLTTTGIEISSFSGSPEYIAALWAVKTCLENPVTQSGFDIADSTIIGGYFYDDSGNLHSGASVDFQNVNNVDGGTVIFSSSLFDIKMTFPSGSTFYCTKAVSSNSTTFTYGASVNGYFASGTLYSISGYLNNLQTGGSPAYVACLTADQSTPTILPSASPTSNSNRIVIGGKAILPDTLPSWDGQSDYSTYINNSLNPYIVNKYPDLQPYIYTPEPPFVPEYPTDFVTGIPKDWTVENPQLPTAADLEFEHYEEDLTGFHPIQEIKETVDIIKAMDFWWWLTENTLDALNLKIFYVIFLTVGVLIFIVWIIGQ